MDQILAWHLIIIIVTWFITKWIMRAIFAVIIMQIVARLIDQVKNNLKGGGEKS